MKILDHSNMKPVVEFRNISKSYDGRTSVIADLNLQIAPGEFLTLLGPSGSGKTTALMMLAGFETPTSGEIFVEGRAYSALPAHKRDIGVVFQSYALFPHMSVGENIAFPLRVRGHDPQEVGRRVVSALDMVRLPNVSERRPSQLSGGQQQRVALARALVYAPKIVLMDEPLGALDRQLREEMQIEIKSIHERVGVTIVYVTHDQGEALTMSDRVAIFNRGVIEQIADPKTLYDQPRNTFVATFIGDSNLLRGAIASRRDGLVGIDIAGCGTVLARAGDEAAGREAFLIVRPENISIGARPMGDRPMNALAGKVDKIVYFGDHVKLVVKLEGGQTLSVKTTTRDIHEAGQAVALTWAPDSSIAFSSPPGVRQQAVGSETKTTFGIL